MMWREKKAKAKAKRRRRRRRKRKRKRKANFTVRCNSLLVDSHSIACHSGLYCCLPSSLGISLIKARFLSKFKDRQDLLSILRNWKQSASSTEIPLTHPFLWIRDTVSSQRIIHPEKMKDEMPVVMRDWVHCLVEWCKDSDNEVAVG